MSGMDRLTALADQLDANAANAERMVELLQPEFDAFEARTGHNVYVVRDYVDHRNAAKRQRQEAADIRELLAHRRASQAAPAPSDGTCAECGCAPVNADSLCATCVDERRAPAPSDALREALERLEAKASAVSSAHARKGGIGFAVAEMGPAIIAARAALSESPAQEGKPRHD